MLFRLFATYLLRKVVFSPTHWEGTFLEYELDNLCSLLFKLSANSFMDPTREGLVNSTDNSTKDAE